MTGVGSACARYGATPLGARRIRPLRWAAASRTTTTLRFGRAVIGGVTIVELPAAGKVAAAGVASLSAAFRMGADVRQKYVDPRQSLYFAK